MQTKFVKYPALAIAALLLLSFGVANNASASNSPYTYETTQQVQFETDIPVEDLVPLLELVQECDIEIPACLMEQLEMLYFEGGSIHVAVDGMVHVNMKTTEKRGVQDTLIHAAWHGNIMIQIGEITVLLEVKCAQIVLRDFGSSCGDINMQLVFCTNADITISGSCGSESFALDTNGKIKISHSEIRIWSFSPEWLAAMLPQPEEMSFEWMEAFIPALEGYSWNY